MNPKLAADYLRFDPITKRPFIDVGYLAEINGISPSNANYGALAEAVAPTIRPLQAARPNERGNSTRYTAQEIGVLKPLFRVNSKGEDAEDLAVTLGLTPEGNEIETNETRFKVHVKWGTGGAAFEAILDLNQGTTIHTTANFLDLSVIRETPTIAEAVLNDVLIYASAGYAGIGHSFAPATFTDTLGTLELNDTARSIVPAFAKTFTVVCRPFNDNPVANLGINVRGSSAPGGSINTYALTDLSNTSTQRENQFPLFNGSRFVDVTNHAAEDADSVQVIYALAL